MAPEGTRRRKMSEPDSPNLLPFKKGAFHLAKLAQVEIVPITITGSYRIGGKNPIRPRPGCIYLKVCDPIPLSVINSKSVDELIAFSRERFESEAVHKTDAEIYDNSYKGWGYFIGYLCYTFFWFWVFFM
jgi:1-acyl-sn-glycerol-3-phosphate acyltransferase